MLRPLFAAGLLSFASAPAAAVGPISAVEDAVFVDLDGDGAVDVVTSSEGRTRAMALLAHDLDGDGDLDVLTCEERKGLGVFWYENPAR